MGGSKVRGLDWVAVVTMVKKKIREYQLWGKANRLCFGKASFVAPWDTHMEMSNRLLDIWFEVQIRHTV